ncbi:MAG TPA: transglutaminase domain-containing protein, partial [Pilimelia sp.]|nr:transglutaminase domain-containing protein [Pilimelia sp.]
MVRWLRPLAVAPVLVAMIGLGGLALGRVYHGPLLAQLVLGAGAGAVAVSAGLRRAPAWCVAPVSVLALAGYLALAARVSAAHAGVPGALPSVVSDALRNGIPRLLTAMIPVEPQPDTVVVPVVAAWLAGLAGAELALRAGRTLLGYAPVTLWYVGALYAVGPNAAPALRPTLAYAGLAALGLAVTAQPDPSNRTSGHA